MAIRSAQATVGTSAAVLVDAAGDDERADFSALVHNKGSVSVYLGGSGVTVATGYEVGAGEAVALSLTGSDTVYAISGTAGQRVDVLRSGVS